jgi:SCP-2 sterol transfer family
MITFADADEFYLLVGGILKNAVEHPDIGPALFRSRLTVRFTITDPDAAVTVDFTNLAVHHGEAGIDPDVELRMSGETANRVWQGKESLPLALARGRAKITGPVAKLLGLLRHADPLYPEYIRNLEKAERYDLIVPW